MAAQRIVSDVLAQIADLVLSHSEMPDRATTMSLARFPWDRWRLAGILKKLGGRPDLLAGAATIAGVPPIHSDMPAGRQRSQGKHDRPAVTPRPCPRSASSPFPALLSPQWSAPGQGPLPGGSP
jgi:hypothetical protein